MAYPKPWIFARILAGWAPLAGQQVLAIYALMEGVSFGGKVWKNVRTVLPTDPLTQSTFSGGESYGLVGQELLLDFNMIYDYRNNRIYFQKRKKG